LQYTNIAISAPVAQQNHQVGRIDRAVAVEVGEAMDGREREERIPIISLLKKAKARKPQPTIATFEAKPKELWTAPPSSPGSAKKGTGTLIVPAPALSSRCVDP